MPKYTADDVKKAMESAGTKMVRNVTMIGSMGHGKSTLMDSFGAKEGYLSENKVGEVLFTLYRADEKERKTNIKANMCHLVTETDYQERTAELTPPKEGSAAPTKIKYGWGECNSGKIAAEAGPVKTDKMLFSLIDTPGHIEYSCETAAAMRMCDGSLITVDVTSGVSVGLEYMIADQLKERVKPTLFVNFIDKEILVLEKEPEEIYQDCAKVVESVNVALHTAEKLGFQNCKVDPLEGSVIFGSALYGWGVSLGQLAEWWGKKMKKDPKDLIKRFWGDQFYNPKKKVWTNVDSDDCTRGFCKFVMEPIVMMHKACMFPQEAKVPMEKCVETFGVKISPENLKKKEKELLKACMQGWLPLADAACKMMATHIPTPMDAQKYRIEHIYKGDLVDKPRPTPTDDDEEEDYKPLTDEQKALGKSMVDCNADGPVMFCATKMSPTGSAGRFYTWGRCFSGTMTTDKYFVQQPDYDPEDPETTAYRTETRAQSINIQLGKDMGSLNRVPAGNICAMGGIDSALTKTATVTDSKVATNFTALKFNVSAVVRIAIRPADPKHLPKLVEGLKRLTKSDLLVACNSEPTGDHIIAGCGEQHLQTCLKDLENEHAGIPFKRGVPTVSYKETVTGTCPKPALSKSPNKHNRLYVIAEPLDEEVCIAIEEYKINAQQDVKKRARIMIDEYGWEKTDCMKIWGFGPADIGVGGANILVDQTKGIQYLNEIKESVNSGLLWASRDGPLAEENMRGCRFNLMDCKLHADSIHRGMGQIQPTARRVFFGAVLTSDARFSEPIFKCVIACPGDVVGGVRQAIAAKRGELQFEEEVDGKTVVTAFLPIAETIGDEPFTKVLQTKTSGKAFSTYAFDHWQLIQTDPLEVGSKAEAIMLDIRERKGLKVEHPDLGDYIDRL